MRRWLGLAHKGAGGVSTKSLKNKKLTDWIWTSAGYDSTLRFFPMLEILEIYIRYLPLKNSLLNRCRKYGIEFNVTAPVGNH